MKRKKIVISIPENLPSVIEKNFDASWRSGGCGTHEYDVLFENEEKFIETLLSKIKENILIGRKNGKFWEPIG